MSSCDKPRAIPTSNQLTNINTKNVSTRSASMSPPETPTTTGRTAKNSLLTH